MSIPTARPTWSLKLEETFGTDEQGSTGFNVIVVVGLKAKDKPLCHFSGDEAYNDASEWLSWLGLPLLHRGSSSNDSAADQIGPEPASLADLYFRCLEVSAAESNELADRGGESMPDPEEPTLANDLELAPLEGTLDELLATAASQRATCSRLTGMPGHDKAAAYLRITLACIANHRKLGPHERIEAGESVEEVMASYGGGEGYNKALEQWRHEQGQ